MSDPVISSIKTLRLIANTRSGDGRKGGVGQVFQRCYREAVFACAALGALLPSLLLVTAAALGVYTLFCGAILLRGGGV